MFNGVSLGQIVNMKVRITNISGKQVAGIKWITSFRDKFGDLITKVRLKSEDVIEVGNSTEITLQSRINEFSAEDQRLAAFDLLTGKVQHQPEVLLFGDGSKLDASKEKAAN